MSGHRCRLVTASAGEFAAGRSPSRSLTGAGSRRPTTCESGIHALQSVSSCCHRSLPHSSIARAIDASLVGDSPARQTIRRRILRTPASRRPSSRSYGSRTRDCQILGLVLTIELAGDIVLVRIHVRNTPAEIPAGSARAPLVQTTSQPRLKKTPVGVEPTRAAQQAATLPSSANVSAGVRLAMHPPSYHFSITARNRTWSSSFARSRANPAHSGNLYRNYPAEESNPVRQIRILPCRPSHPQGSSHWLPQPRPIKKPDVACDTGSGCSRANPFVRHKRRQNEGVFTDCPAIRPLSVRLN